MLDRKIVFGALALSLSALALGCSASAQESVVPPGERTVPPAPYDPAAVGVSEAVLAGGCFWGMEGVFERLDGVLDVQSGYAGGTATTANYEAVSSGTTGHAESVRIVYDPARISYGTLLEVYFGVAHDPTELDYQGPDHGTQYRSEIFYGSALQEEVARRYVAALEEAKVFPSPIVTRLEPLAAFFPAEDYHQDFMDRNPDYPYIVQWDLPKVRELERRYPGLLSAAALPEETWKGYPVYASGTLPELPVRRSEAAWRQELQDERYRILRAAGTEPAFSGATWNEHRSGTYYSAATGQPLFRSESKFESGTGWPSFSAPMTPDAVVLREDGSFGMSRIEVLDASSGSHLGHVFDDGPGASAAFPQGTGLRFCMNSASMIFVPDGEEPPDLVKRWAAGRGR